ncbi:hypothetical protein KHA80_21640 [Anaerobacillus sp. HL2]|nr:hypothetical protein KHA80_21640 [Anaerobacillus sp. HL2]
MLMIILNKTILETHLEQQLQAWKNQFDFITTGAEYVQQLDEEDRLAKQAFPFGH